MVVVFLIFEELMEITLELNFVICLFSYNNHLCCLGFLEISFFDYFKSHEDMCYQKEI